jgi:hypothetical protein
LFDQFAPQIVFKGRNVAQIVGLAGELTKTIKDFVEAISFTVAIA